MNFVVKNNFKSLKGKIEIPSDKSVSHRAVILGALAKGKSVIKNFSSGADPNSTINVCKQLGVEISKNENTVIINSDAKFLKPGDVLDCGNSGTTMRMMAGVLAGQNFNSVLCGDKSLSCRPMKRIIEPLTLMGANISSQNNKAPLNICGSLLKAINYKSPIASAQVKSCILLAGLFAQGTTIYKEIYPSRNHTELMLKSMGADIKFENNSVILKKSELSPLNIEIFGDISSAAFFIAAGLIVPNSEIVLRNVGLNPTRAGIIEVVKKMGGNIEILNQREICSELVGDIKVCYSENLIGCEISGEIIPSLIDEIPIICVLATQASGQTVIKDAQDLRNKESDRISTIVNELKRLGADIEETKDGMIINGKSKLTGGVEVNSYKDHRLAMSLYVAGMIVKKEISIVDFDWVKISFPEFEELMERLKV